jgi:hypothetical protein
MDAQAAFRLACDEHRSRAVIRPATAQLSEAFEETGDDLLLRQVAGEAG